MSRKTPTRPPGRPGRPPAGDDGEAVHKYPRLTMRLPGATLAALDAWQAATKTPRWRLIDRAINDAIGALPEAQRRAIAAVKRARAGD
jgi:hypothetical protein